TNSQNPRPICTTPTHPNNQTPARRLANDSHPTHTTAPTHPATLPAISEPTLGYQLHQLDTSTAH
ncbi:hypothetical protein AAHH80_37545, partial [Burkholderia pseudomallei]